MPNMALSKILSAFPPHQVAPLSLHDTILTWNTDTIGVDVPDFGMPFSHTLRILDFRWFDAPLASLSAIVQAMSDDDDFGDDEDDEYDEDDFEDDDFDEDEDDDDYDEEDIEELEEFDADEEGFDEEDEDIDFEEFDDEEFEFEDEDDDF